MKAFISVPMNGRSNDEVLADLAFARATIRTIFCNAEHLEIIDCFVVQDIRPRKHMKVWKLGQAIKMISDCDVVYFCEGWQSAKDCLMEHKICELYDIQRIEV